MKKATKQERILTTVLLLILVAALTAVICLLTQGLMVEKTNEDVAVDVVEVKDTVDEPKAVEEPEVTRVDFQPVVEAWANSVSGNRSVLIYDLEREETVGEYNIDEDYSIASLYKLFVVYDGYRRVQSGEWQADAAAGMTGRTILECLDLSIRESYSPCAETLWGMIGRESLEQIIVNDFGIAHSDISHLISNPRDISAIMQIFYRHADITDASLIARMWDSFLNQPTTTYNWRQGLPSGFTDANVYNKVGWDWNGSSWNLYHDAAIVEFPNQNRHFVVVVMTNHIPFEKIRKLGAEIEQAFLAADS